MNKLSKVENQLVQTFRNILITTFHRIAPSRLTSNVLYVEVVEDDEGKPLVAVQLESTFNGEEAVAHFEIDIPKLQEVRGQLLGLAQYGLSKLIEHTEGNLRITEQIENATTEREQAQLILGAVAEKSNVVG